MTVVCRFIDNIVTITIIVVVNGIITIITAARYHHQHSPAAWANVHHHYHQLRQHDYHVRCSCGSKNTLNPINLSRRTLEPRIPFVGTFFDSFGVASKDRMPSSFSARQRANASEIRLSPAVPWQYVEEFRV